MDRDTLTTPDGGCLLNLTAEAGFETGKIITRSVECIGLPGHRAMVVSRDAPTVWETYNGWAVPSGVDAISTTSSRPEFQIDRAAPEWRFVGPSQVGIGYVSPGYQP
jgi:hypothetical protein